jgi:hypothetical protein
MDPNAATHTFDKTIRDKQESSDRTEQSKKKGRIAHATQFREMSYRYRYLFENGNGDWVQELHRTLVDESLQEHPIHRSQSVHRQTFFEMNHTSNASKCSKYPILQIRGNSNQNMVQLSRR